MLTILQWTKDSAVRRFAAWMIVGAVFILAVTAAEFLSGVPRIP